MAAGVASIALKTVHNLLQEAKFLIGVRSELKALEIILKETRSIALLINANNANETIGSWLTRVRDLAYRADDTISLYAAVNVSSNRSLLHKYSCILTEGQGYSLHQIASEIKDIESKLASFNSQHLIRSISSSSAPEMTIFKFPFETEVFVGKEEEVEQLVSLVVSEEAHRVISLWGMGVLKDVLKQLSLLHNSSNSSITELARLLFQVQEAKKCMLVIDDIWSIDHWEQLKNVFQPKTKILLTTRIHDVENLNDEIRQVLHLSFLDLPYYLMPCFLYMVKLMDIAQGYLSELASRSIARDDPTRGQTTRTCKLHDALPSSNVTIKTFIPSHVVDLESNKDDFHKVQHRLNSISTREVFSHNCFLRSFPAHAMCSTKFRRRTPSPTTPFSSPAPPDSFTLSCVLKSMSEVALDGPLPARMVHCYVVKCGFDWDVFVGNGLVTYYSRCGDVASARSLFNEMPERDLVSWNSMISGYSQGGFFEECKGLYKRMLDSEAVRPDAVTAVSVLQACAQSSDLITGMAVHQYLIENEVEMDLSLCNSIIGVYAKCGSLDYARQLFEEMSEKDEITYGTIISSYMVHGFVEEAMNIFRGMWNPGLNAWNAVISGSVQNNQHDRVLDLVREMQGSGFKPNAVTLSSILPAIPFVSHLKGGKEVHAYAIKNNYHTNIYVFTAMVDVYAKLGFLRGAQKIFDLAQDRSVIVWTAIISSYAAHGDASSALSLFEEMLNSKINPDAITFTAILAACAHAGLVDEAREIFGSLLPKYGIQPLPNHYACVVACLSRVGKLSEAVDFVKKMPSEPTAQVWGALLSGASEAGEVELAEFVCEHLFELEPENPTNYIVMANLYSKAGRWEEAESVRERLAKRGFKKVAGSSRIETSGGFVRGSAMNERRGKIW
ncbi:hypothetical protein SASPL_138351 [Salvia splendens]|uniref:Disease resistance protein RPM1 n=1 Tax=Salvia splendens TaxID=180675 RepID=A0A8X8WVB4_SALSN|nr:hypothetical protein SASPL_138351 [Salvia splendens]